MPEYVKCGTTARPNSVWIAVALALVAMAVYCPVTGFPFVDFDDDLYVTANPQVQAGLTAGSFQWAWESEVAGNWHPITMLSHIVDCQMFGLKPWWPHLVNVLLHAANTVLLFSLLKRMTGTLWRSAIVAALFALHPLHVESVAWVSERKDVLSTLFWFLTTWAYVRYAEKWRVASGQWPVFYGLSLLFFALGLMSKPMLVTLPFTLLLLDYWPLGRMKAGVSFWRLAAEKIPFFAMSAVLCMVAFRLQKQGGWMWGLQEFPLGTRVGNALVSYVRYIEMTFWPRHLAALYINRSTPWSWWIVTLAAILLLAVCGLVLRQGRRRPYLAMGWLWYLGTLVPVIGLVAVGDQAMADRYTYVPLIGLFVMLVWGGWELAGFWRLAGFARAVVVAALAACAVLTARQEFYWKDTETLLKRILAVTSNNYAAHFDLGMFYLKANRTEEAIPHFQAVTEEKPNFVQAHNNLAGIFLGQKRYDEALQQYQIAVRLQPDSYHYGNLARALAEVAGARHDANALAGAVQTFQEAARLDPSRADIWTQLGMLCASQNRMQEAQRAFRELIRLRPNSIDANRWLGNTLAAQNKWPDAISCYLTVLRLNPADYAAECNLARVLTAQGKRTEAADHYRHALRIEPNLPEAQKGLSELEKSPDLPQGGNH